MIDMIDMIPMYVGKISSVPRVLVV